MVSTITWLHLSDPQFSSTRRYDTQTVLHSFLEDMRVLVHEEQLKPNFIVVTGDIGFSGQLEEYDLARRFFDELLSVTNLNKNLLFLVPGNHDVDWNAVSSFAVTDKDRLINQDMVQRFLASDEERTKIFMKLGHYRTFINKSFPILG